MKWVKLQVALRSNERWGNASDAARALYTQSLMIAGAIDTADGSLLIGDKAITEKDLAYQCGRSAAWGKRACAELIELGLFVRHGETYMVAKFAEKAGETPSAVRMRRHRSGASHDASQLPSHSASQLASPPASRDAQRIRELDSSAAKAASSARGDAREAAAEKARQIKQKEISTGFAGWLFDEAKTLGLHGKHVRKEPVVQADLEAAMLLLNRNDLDDAKARGLRMLHAIVAGQLRKNEPTVRFLTQCWDWSAVAGRRGSGGKSAPADGGPEFTKNDYGWTEVEG